MPETPASPALATACFLHAGAPNATFQNVQLSLNLGESCSTEVLREAWQKVVAVRGILRSSISKAATGETLRRERDAPEVSWSTLHWKDFPPEEISALWKDLQEKDAVQPFDPAMPPLVRFQAIELPGGHCHLLVTYPKLLLDEDSLFHILCEWIEALQGVPPQIEETPAAPAPASPATAEWWSRFFAGNPEPLNFEVFPRQILPPGISVPQEHNILLDRESSRELKTLCQRIGLPVRDVFLAVWSLVLSRLTSSDDALLLAHCSENFLPFRAAPKNDTRVEAWLKDTAKSEKERAQNAAISLERALLLAEPARRLREFPAAFIWSPPALNDRIHDVYPRWINFDARIVSRSQFPLTLQVRDGNRFLLQLESDPALCPPAEAEILLQRMAKALEAILENPTQKVGAISFLTDSENQSFHAAPKAAPAENPPSIEKTISATAARQPEALAITGPNEADLTFAELDSHSRSLATWLRNENLADGWNIAVCLTPTPWLPVAVLGILRAGDTCVPLDSTSAAAWLSGQIESSDVELIICDSRTAPNFDGLTRKLLILDQQWETVAVSTGGGEGAAQKNAFLLTGTELDAAPALRSLKPDFVTFACHEALALQALGPGDRIALIAAAGSGAFVETLLCSLMSGATLVLPEDNDPLAVVETSSLTHLRLSIGQWRALAARLQRTSSLLPDSLRSVCVETASATPGLQATWSTLHNGHVAGIFFHSPAGLSGAGVRFLSSGPIPLTDTAMGLAGPGVTASLRDPAGQHLPPHYAGRMEISFPACDDGTYSLPAWRDRSGAFHFVTAEGDAAAQALRSHPEVLDAHCAIVQTSRRSELGAWVILRSEATATTAGLMQLLSHHLPENLRPDFLIAVTEFPLTSAGAIHAAALPRPVETAAPPSRQEFASPLPASATTATVAKDWDPLVLLHKTDDAPVLFLVHDLEGESEKYRALASLLKADWTVYGTTARGLHNPSACHLTVETEAAALVETICLLDPDGPFHLFGYSFGAVLAMEMARQLRVAGRQVPYLALAGARPPENNGPDDWKRALTRVFSFSSAKNTPAFPSASTPVATAHLAALKNYRARPLVGPAGIVLGTDMGRDVEEAWLTCAPEAIVETISCPTTQMLTEPPVKRLAVIMREWVVPGGGDQ